LSTDLELVPVNALTLLSQSEHIHGLIQQSTAAILSAGAGMQRDIATHGSLPGVSQALDQQAAATQGMREATVKLTALIRSLQGEIRERTLHEQRHIPMIAVKLLAAIKSPCVVSGRDGLVSVWVGGSIGISVFPKDAVSAAELIQRADAAMYVAKDDKSGFAFAQ
jgi:hypothetical protein